MKWTNIGCQFGIISIIFFHFNFVRLEQGIQRRDHDQRQYRRGNHTADHRRGDNAQHFKVGAVTSTPSLTIPTYYPHASLLDHKQVALTKVITDHGCSAYPNDVAGHFCNSHSGRHHVSPSRPCSISGNCTYLRVGFPSRSLYVSPHLKVLADYRVQCHQKIGFMFFSDSPLAIYGKCSRFKGADDSMIESLTRAIMQNF